MIITPDTRLITSGNLPSLMIPGSTILSIGSETSTEPAPDLSAIDLTASTLDSRVTYIGPAHTVIGSDGNLATSAANAWPVEYANGVAVGRHEPEPAGTNYLLDTAFANISDTGATPVTAWIRSQGSNITIADSGSFDVAECQVGWTATGVYTEQSTDATVDAGWLAEITDQGGGSDWDTLTRTFTVAAEALIRYYIVRAVDSGATNYMYGKAPAMPAGDYVASVRRRVTAENLECQATQIESGSIPTSPIFNAADIDTPETASRAASSVTVTNPGGATGISVHYSDGTTATVSFDSDTATIPLASQAWASRYITQITFNS